MSWIKIRIRFSATKEGKSLTPDEAHRIVDQVRQDALFGTFADLDESYWKKRMDRAPSSLSEADLIEGTDKDEEKIEIYSFELRLASDLFPPTMGGFQHLFGMLAGDLMRFTLPPIAIKKWEVRELEFPKDWEVAHLLEFREKSNSIADIRKSFQLEDGMPLLAFSFKPRVGFSLESLEEIAFDVLSNGFNIVELDTRYLPPNPTILNKLIDMAVTLSDKVRDHVGRLSINMTIPPDMLLEHVQRLCKEIAQPAVLKIDGALDGLSAIQMVRRSRIADIVGNPPIVTCYPLLQTTLAPYLAPDQFIRALAMSGIDILYPGRRPDIGKMV